MLIDLTVVIVVIYLFCLLVLVVIMSAGGEEGRECTWWMDVLTVPTVDRYSYL